jgi:type IV secretory pathway VirB10-like protein
MRTTKEDTMISRTLRSLVILSGLALMTGACSRSKDEAPPATAAGATTTAAAPAGSSTDQWAWADKPVASMPPVTSTPPASASQPADVEQPRPVETPRAEPKPRKPTSKPEPTNRLESRDDDEKVERGEDRVEAPRTVMVTAHAGTALEARLQTALDSATASVGQPVSGELTADVMDATGRVVLPRGTQLDGQVTEVVSAKKVKKKSVLAWQFTKATLPDGSTAVISAGQRLEGKGYTKKDGAIIGGSAAGGAVLGQILGHDSKSTAGGAVLGAAIGTAVSMSKKGEEVEVAPGAALSLTLDTPVTVERPVG